MALINPPAWMQAGSYPARTDRLVISALLGYPGFLVDEATPLRIRQGVKPSYTNQQLKARAAATPNMTVIVSAGFCVIDNHDTGGAGTYVCANDSDVTLTIAPAGGAGQFRKDAVVASVYDAETAGSVSEWRLEVIQGAYAASAGAAVRPSVPPNAQLIADVAVGASVTSVSAANITDTRQFTTGLGGILEVPSNAAPNRMHPGQMLYLTDVGRFVYGTLAGATADLIPQDWVSYTPAWTAATANPSIGNGNLKGVYCRIGKTIHVRINMLAGSSTTFGTGAWRFTVPVPVDATESTGFYHVGSVMTIDASDGADYPGTCFVSASNGFIGTATAVGGSTAQPGAVGAVVPFPWASGDSFHLQLTYEAA